MEILENRDQSATDLTRELGLRQNQPYKWREEIQQKSGVAFKGPGSPSKDQMKAYSRLKQENKRLTVH